MTPEQIAAINVTIAEACGYSIYSDGDMHCMHKNGKSVSSWHYHKDILWHENAPDYYHSLDAMREAWQTLNRKQRVEFSKHLRGVVVNAGGHAASFDWDIVACVENATAPQRAEAFLRTIGKWPF